MSWYEALIARPEWELRRLFQAAGVGEVDYAKLVGLIEPFSRRWPVYADERWFRDHEEACDNVLDDFFATGAQAHAAAAAPAHRAM